jgi:hypothetical protein
MAADWDRIYTAPSQIQDSPMTHLFRHIFLPFALLIASLQPAHAALDAGVLQSQIEQLNVQGAALLTQVRAVRGSQLTSPLAVVALQNASTDYANAIDAVASKVQQETAGFSITPNLLATLDKLTKNQAALSRETARMGSSAALVSLTGSTTLNSNLAATYATILALSDDIGEMADRILVMADKILIMADNIGEMADRILVTQQIQSANYALTLDAILQTQENMLLMMAIMKTCR